jgi:alpha-D-xyloside xylohydrolase
MFGPDVLVAPVMSPGARARSVYLPAGTEWKNAKSGLLTAGGETLQVEAPLDTIPVFIRRGVELPIEI